MMNQTKKVDTRRIDAWSSWLLILLAIGSFVLSYAAMYQLAVDSALGMLAILWPAITESAVVIFSLGMLRARLHGYKNQWVWFLILVCTALSVVFNVTHAPMVEGQHWAITAAVYALPPIFLFLSFKLLLWQIEKDNERTNAVDTLDDLKGQIDKLTTELDKRKTEFDAEIRQRRDLMSWELQTRLEGQRTELARLRQIEISKVAELGQKQAEAESYLTKLNRQIDEVKRQLEETKAEMSKAKSASVQDLNAAKQAKIETRRQEVLELLSEGKTPKDIAEILEVSEKTIERDITALNGKVSNGHSNGNGSH